MAGRDERPDAVAASAMSSATSSPPDYNREACHLLSLRGNDLLASFDSEIMLPIADAATKAGDRGSSPPTARWQPSSPH